MGDNIDASGFNADELVAPGWLHELFLTKVLSNHEHAPELKVTGLHFSPASAKGDHYASVMFRAKVEYTKWRGAGASTKSLIIKTMPEQEGHKKEMFAESYLFKTEIGMYSKVLPEFERILCQVGDERTLYVDCIYHSLETRQVMIFEDLVDMGYVVVRRGFTQEEICSAYRKLAKIHAISMNILSTFLPVGAGIRAHSFDIGNLMEKDETRRSCYHLEDYVKKVTKMLARFEKFGYFVDL